MISFLEKNSHKWEADPNSGCWLWNKAINQSGYAVSHNPNGSNLVHRRAYEEKFGKLQDGILACHRCDVRCCVNPDHIFAGTYRDNTVDMYKKGRKSRGDIWGLKNGRARLSPDAAGKIRDLYAKGARQIDLAAEFNVGQATISRVVLGKVWT